MEGFELYINGEKISAALKSGVVTVIAIQHSNETGNSIEIDVRGLNTSDPTEDETIDWYGATLKEGDEFTVRIKDITENSPAKEILKRKREPANDRKLKNYNDLKKELEELGLI